MNRKDHDLYFKKQDGFNSTSEKKRNEYKEMIYNKLGDGEISNRELKQLKSKSKLLNPNLVTDQEIDDLKDAFFTHLQKPLIITSSSSSSNNNKNKNNSFIDNIENNIKKDSKKRSNDNEIIIDIDEWEQEETKDEYKLGFTSGINYNFIFNQFMAYSFKIPDGYVLHNIEYKTIDDERLHDWSIFDDIEMFMKPINFKIKNKNFDNKKQILSLSDKIVISKFQPQLIKYIDILANLEHELTMSILLNAIIIKKQLILFNFEWAGDIFHYIIGFQLSFNDKIEDHINNHLINNIIIFDRSELFSDYVFYEKAINDIKRDQEEDDEDDKEEDEDEDDFEKKKKTSQYNNIILQLVKNAFISYLNYGYLQKD
jgi:hypothetical protein